MRDFYSNIDGAVTLRPHEYSATENGSAVDVTRASGAVALVQTGEIVDDGEFSIKLQESPDGVTWADVPENRVQSNVPGLLEAFAFYRIGYLGRMPKIRAVLVKEAGGVGIVAACTIALRPLVRPVP